MSKFLIFLSIVQYYLVIITKYASSAPWIVTRQPKIYLLQLHRFSIQTLTSEFCSSFHILPIILSFSSFMSPQKKKKCHVSLDYKTIMTVPGLSVAIPNATRRTLSYELPVICSNLQTIIIVASLDLISPKTDKCHINRSHAKLECFKVKVEILSETMENLMEQTLETRLPN